MIKIPIKQFRRGPYIIKHEMWDMGDGHPIKMKSAYSPEGAYIGPSRTTHRLFSKYGITEFYLKTPTDNVVSVGYSPSNKKWYGWSHRAISGYATFDEAAQFAESVS
jgi:hypothetical protein